MHRNVKTIQWVVGASALFVLAVLARPTYAITLIPPSLELGANPGETLSTKMKLFNEAATDVTLYPSTDNFTAADEAGTPKFLNTPAEDLASWITVPAGPIILKPGERTEVPIDIHVPNNADPGGHYAAIFFSDQPITGPTGTGVSVTNKVGTLVITRIEGTIREAGRLAQFSTDGGKSMYTRTPVTFSIRFENQGNVHLRPTGSITVRNMLGGTTVVLPINPTQGAVLPSSIRKFQTAWDRTSSSSAKSNFFSEIGAEWKNFALGPYTAEVSLTYGQTNDKSAVGSVRFWVFPWHVLLVVLVLVVLIVTLLILLIGRYNRWILRHAQKK